MTTIPLEAFGFKPTYSAAQNDLAGVRWADFVKANPYCRIEAPHAAMLYPISQTVCFEAPFTFEGAGRGHVHESNPAIVDAGTAFKWLGASGGTMMRAGPVAGPSGLRLFNLSMRGFHLDANDAAGRCFEALSLDDFTLHFSAQNARETCVHEGVVGQLAAGERKDCMNGRLGLVGAALSANAKRVFTRGGDLVSNSCKNTYEMPCLLHKYDHAAVVENGDTCTWEELTAHYWGSEPQTHRGLLMKAGASPLTCARADDLQWLSPGAGGAEIQGVEGGANPAHSIDIMWDADNWDPALLRVGTGASVRVHNVTVAFSAFKASGTFANQGWFDAITGWGEEYDRGRWGGCFDPAAGAFTALYPGLYEFSFNICHTDTMTAGSWWDFALEVNEAVVRRWDYVVTATAWGSFGRTCRVPLEQGAVVRLLRRKLAGTGDWTVAPDMTATRFEGCLVR